GPPRADVRRAEVGAESKRGQAWFEKGSGTFVRSTLRAVPAKVPDPFSNQAPLCVAPCGPFRQRCLTPFRIGSRSGEPSRTDAGVSMLDNKQLQQQMQRLEALV